MIAIACCQSTGYVEYVTIYYIFYTKSYISCIGIILAYLYFPLYNKLFLLWYYVLFTNYAWLGTIYVITILRLSPSCLLRALFSKSKTYLFGASSLVQSHASAYRRSLAVSSTIISYICLCGHFGGVSELQTSLDVSDL